MVVGCVARVLSRSEKSNYDHNARVRLKMRKFRDVLSQDDETVDLGDERGGMATLVPGRAKGTSLGRTDANDECPSQRYTTSEQWQPDVFTNPTSVPRNGGKVGVETDDGSQEEVRLKVFNPKDE